MHNSIPDGFLNAALAEAVTTACLNGVPQSHETNGALVFTLQRWIKLHIVALQGGSLKAAAAHEGTRVL